MLATGSRAPRDLPVPGRELDGIHFAMDYLYDRNRWVATQTGTPTGCEPPALRGLTAEGKHVVVIGGGDTGADCVGNSLREGALSITQLELLPEPPPKRPDDRTPWPLWPQKFRLSYAMEEAKDGRHGRAGLLDRHDALRRRRRRPRARAALRAGRAGAAVQAGRRAPRASCKADLVLLAMGFLHPEQDAARRARRRQGRSAATPRPSSRTTTSVDGVFAAGDARRGQSLIVWAINEGRQCARMVDRYLGDARRRRRAGADGDADAGPASGPPQHVGPGVAA